MKVNQARDYLYENLKHLGCIQWHNNTTSYYLKFNDCRIGSIRLSNHNSRKKYNYKINVIEPDGNFKKYQMDNIIEIIHNKVLKLKSFHPKKCIVYKNGRYHQINKNEYKNHILTGGK